MHWLPLCLLFGLFHQFKNECVIDDRSVETIWTAKLEEDILTYPIAYEPPCNDTEVKVKMEIKNFAIEVDTIDVLRLNMWKELTWVNPVLKWDPNSYHDIKELQVDSMYFWTPDLQLYNGFKMAFFNSIIYNACKLKYTGEVTCTSIQEDVVPCVSTFKNWPYDSQDCFIHFGLKETQNNVKFVPAASDGNSLDFITPEYGSDWTIFKHREVSNTSDKIQIKITLTLERNSEGLEIMIVNPSILLSILSVSTMVLDVEKVRRFWLSCFSVFCHFFFLTIISENIPAHSPDTPPILLFYKFSLFLNSVLVLKTLSLMRLRNRQTVAPYWIVSINNFVLNSFGRHLIWPRWKTTLDLVPHSANINDVEAWNSFANILNSVSIIGVVLTYSILVPLYIPRPYPL
jgi:hypothetical protein